MQRRRQPHEEGYAVVEIEYFSPIGRGETKEWRPSVAMGAMLIHCGLRGIRVVVG